MTMSAVCIISKQHIYIMKFVFIKTNENEYLCDISLQNALTQNHPQRPNAHFVFTMVTLYRLFSPALRVGWPVHQPRPHGDDCIDRAGDLLRIK